MTEAPYPNYSATNALKDQLHEAWPPSRRNGYPCVPATHVEAIATYLTSVMAELIESYLDAGSERDAIAEGLYDAILAECKGWTEEDVVQP